ncbi:putative ribonuclease H-like domain-containing protein, partial [Tanacetum coccineum]
TFLLKNGYRRGTIDKTLFLKKDKHDIILVQVYVDDIIFGSTKKSWCDEFEALMKIRFQMSSMGELTFFLGLQTASTPIETPKPLFKDEEASDVDVHLYRSMIGSLMYLTASRPDIIFAVPVPLDHFPVNALTSKVFSFMVKKGKHFSGKVTPLFASMLVQPTADEGAPSERPSEAQPTPSPIHTSEVPLEPQTDSSPNYTSEKALVGIFEVSDQAKEIQHLKAQITKLKKQAKPVIKHHRAWLKSVSLKKRLTRKHFSKKQRVHQEFVSKQGRKFAKGESSFQRDPLFDEIPEDTVDHMETENAQDVGRTRDIVDEDKEIKENILSTEDCISVLSRRLLTTRRKLKKSGENKGEESIRKRKHGTRKKMKSRKRRYIQNTSDDDSEKENDELRLHLTITPDEEKEVDYEILDRKYPIKEWKTECLGTKPQADKAEHIEEINQNVVIRSNGQKRYFSTLMRVLSIFDREDLNAVYQLVMDRFQDEIPEGFDRVLWGDLMVMFNPDDEDKFWNLQQDWNIGSQTPASLVKSWLVQDKTVLGKDNSNLLIADSLLKTIWFIIALKDLFNKGLTNLLYDNSSPRPPEELNLEIADTFFESLSPSPILVKDSDSLMEEIDLFLASDESMPLGIEDDDYVLEGDIRFLEELLNNDSLPLPENESFSLDHFNDPSPPRPPPEPPDVEICFDFKPDKGV